MIVKIAIAVLFFLVIFCIHVPVRAECPEGYWPDSRSRKCVYCPEGKWFDPNARRCITPGEDPSGETDRNFQRQLREERKGR